MQVIEHLAKAKDTLVSFEVLPPLKGKIIAYIYEHLYPLMEFKPSWINVTYHCGSNAKKLSIKASEI